MSENPGSTPRTPATLAALRSAADLLARADAAGALRRLQAALVAEPGQRELLLYAAIAHRALGQAKDALNLLDGLQFAFPGWGRIYEQRGHCERSAGRYDAAVAAYSQAVQLNDMLTDSWRALADLRPDGRAAAHARLARIAALPREVVRAADLFNDGEVTPAEEVVRAFLVANGPHVEAMRLLAKIALHLDILDDAELLLDHVLQLAPEYTEARHELAVVLSRRRRFFASLVETERLLAAAPDHPDYLLLYAQACDGIGRVEEALAVYRRLLAAAPDDGFLQLAIAHLQKTAGQAANAIASLSAAAAHAATYAAACHGLANMKTFRFDDGQIATMQAALANAAGPTEDRYYLSFALGKALEDRGDYAEAFRYYALGNELKRGEGAFDPQLIERDLSLIKEVCSRDFFRQRAGWGCPRPDPIFVVGMPRAGSTLIEQILASHSLIDGTLELPDIQQLVQQFRNRAGPRAPPHYPGVLTGLARDEFEKMGRIYLEDTLVYRQGAPLFVDKMPANFRDIGFIHLILPNARIIDARREPMACCFGNFKQLFTKGQGFSYGLEDIGRYYRSYVELMEHWDEVLPGKVLRVNHEDVIDDLEGSVRRMLAFCGLEFEPQCLEFYRTARSVRTVSSEQVRRPIYREGMNQWRHFEPWLEPLKQALGPLYRPPPASF